MSEACAKRCFSVAFSPRYIAVHLRNSAVLSTRDSRMKTRREASWFRRGIMMVALSR